MGNFKRFKQTQNWGEILLAFQNEAEGASFCDLKLICSEGHVLVHKAILMDKLNQTFWASSEITLPPNVTLLQTSKLVLLFYTGQVIINHKADLQQLKPLFNAFQMERLKRHPFPRNVIKTRRGSTTGQNGESSNPSDPNRLTDRKVRAVKDDGEHVYIFGDGTTMALPPPNSGSSSRGAAIYYDENGGVTNNNGRMEEGFPCIPCSMIFCESVDFMEHSENCSIKRAPQAPPKVIKIETDFIKVESTTSLAVECDDEADKGMTRPVGSITVCLVCVTSCRDASELIVHSNEKHNISPDKDYDIGAWNCKRCKCPGSSNELSVFLQHVYHCRREKRKRTVKPDDDVDSSLNSQLESSRKRRKTTSWTIRHDALVDRDEIPILEFDEPVENHNSVVALPPPTCFAGVLDTSETLLRSPKALSTLNYNKQHGYCSKLLPQPSPASKNTTFLSSTNPMVTFKGIAVNGSSKKQATLAEDSTGTWVKKKNKKKKSLISTAAAAVTTNCWTCSRCKKYFPSQKCYMCHDCKPAGAVSTRAPLSQ